MTKLINLIPTKSKSLNEADVYKTAGAMIPQVGPATVKNLDKLKSEDPDRWKMWVKNDKGADGVIKATNEYGKWLDSTISMLDKIYSDDFYKMYVASKKSGGSSRDDHDHLGIFLNGLKSDSKFIKRYK